MTGLRDQRDIERILRSTLTEVAGTVNNAGRVTAPVGSDQSPPRRRSARWAAPLAAAAAVAAIAAAAALAPSHTDKNAPIAPPTSSSNVPGSSTPPPTAKRATGVRLEWWTTPIPAGYTETQRIVTAQFSGEQLIKKDDPQRNTIGNGGGPAGVLVRRWTPGTFHASTVAAPVTVQIGAHAGLFGATPAGLFDDEVPYASGTVPTLAVHVATDEWITLAGATSQTQRKDELVRVAKTVLSASRTTPMAVPFRLTGLPVNLRVLGASENLDPAQPDGLQIDVTDGPLSGSLETVQQTTDLSLQIWRHNAIPTSQTGGRATVDNRTGVLDSTGRAAYFPIGARLTDIELDGPGATPAALQAVLAGLEWSPDPSDERTWYDATDMLH